jgi:hypothetical protein
MKRIWLIFVRLRVLLLMFIVGGISIYTKASEDKKLRVRKPFFPLKIS